MEAIFDSIEHWQKGQLEFLVNIIKTFSLHYPAQIEIAKLIELLSNKTFQVPTLTALANVLSSGKNNKAWKELTDKFVTDIVRISKSH